MRHNTESTSKVALKVHVGPQKCLNRGKIKAQVFLYGPLGLVGYSDPLSMIVSLLHALLLQTTGLLFPYVYVIIAILLL